MAPVALIYAVNDGELDAVIKVLLEPVFLLVPVLQGLCELLELPVLVLNGVFVLRGLRLCDFNEVDVLVLRLEAL